MALSSGNLPCGVIYASTYAIMSLKEVRVSGRLILKELSRYNIGTYSDIIYRNSLLYQGKDAFIYGLTRVTFPEYNKRVNRLIHALLSMGLKKGDGIGVLSWNCLEYTDVYGAAMKGGFIISPFNPRLKTDELKYIINDSEVKALFVGPELAETIETLRPHLPLVIQYISLEQTHPQMKLYSQFVEGFPNSEPDMRVEEDDPMVIYYTSGTTGVPRGAIYTQAQCYENHQAKALHLCISTVDKHVMIMPLFHIGGSSHFWAYFFAGASNVIMTQRSYDPAAILKAIQDEKATGIHIVPTHLVGLLETPNLDSYDLTSLAQILYAASPMPLELLKKGINRFGQIFVQGYGQSETGPDVTILRKEYHDVLDKPPNEQKSLTSCGHPFIGVHVRIVDEEGEDVETDSIGEIVVQSKYVMKEYWRKQDYTSETKVNGWVHTGDMGYYDDKGFIYILDRKKDLVITGGENVYPREVEEVLYRHPAILECAVIGVPDEKWVERVHAVIVVREGQELSSDDIITFCKTNLAGYKAPKSVEFAETLPKNPQGKILKRELRIAYRHTH
jgi:long-chain acyl-CoA synthetase